LGLHISGVPLDELFTNRRKWSDVQLLICMRREGTLCNGDEIINVNGRRLRGLTMAGARDALGSGPRDVDLVIARAQDQKASAAPRPKSRMPESSVDYENVLILPATADTPPEEHNDYEEVAFKCPAPAPASKAIKRRQHFQKKSKVFRRAIASYTGGGQGEELMDERTGSLEGVKTG
jgi:hypothetical protein